MEETVRSMISLIVAAMIAGPALAQTTTARQVMETLFYYTGRPIAAPDWAVVPRQRTRRGARR
jgi:hypothetical protein